MAKKTEEDWFLRGGERPDPANGNDNAAPDVHPKFARLVIDELADYDDHDGVHEDGETLRDYVVTMSRRRTVVQQAKVRVKAHSKHEAMDLAEERAPCETDEWNWSDVDDYDSEEFEDVEANDAEVAI